MKRKLTVTILVTALTLLMVTAAFAATYSNSAEIVANLTGKTTEQVLDERSAGKTFGQIAEENEVLDEFRKEMLEYKKEIIDQRVEEGRITQEQADAIKERIEERSDYCLGTPGISSRGQGFCGGNGFGFNKGFRGQRGYGMGF